jgi:hypothetical protein
LRALASGNEWAWLISIVDMPVPALVTWRIVRPAAPSANRGRAGIC